MLTIRVLNVGQGSSIVIEYFDGDKKYFGLVDSNHVGSNDVKALSVLKAMGAESLSFICLTHPHKDHFSGLYEIISAYRGKIDTFYSCPFGDLISNRERFKKYAQHLYDLRTMAGSEKHRVAAKELAQILKWADSREVDWCECAGEENKIAPMGFAPVNIHTLTPAKISKGAYIERIDSGNPWMFGGIQDNDISLSLRFQYEGETIVLGGDASRGSWIIRRKFEKNSGTSISARIVNLPHHGSIYDSPPDVMTQLFSDHEERYGLTSANGLKHPNIETIDWMFKNEIDPYCTNLIPECGNNTRALYTLGNLNKELARILRETAVAAGTVQACQGDITIKITATNTTVTPEFNHYCDFRRGSRRLIGG